MKKSFIRTLFLIAGLLIPMTMIFFSTRDKKRSRISGNIHEKSFVVIVPSYNNAPFCEQNLLSILSQQYQNFRVIYIDDASTDETFEKVQAVVERSSLKDKITLIRQTENQGAIKNIYEAVHSCKDDEIVVRVDGDDFLAHPLVLKKLNRVYYDPEIWMTYGNYLDYPAYKQQPQVCQKFPKSIIQGHRFRQYKLVTAHLHTFYAGLFKKVAAIDLMKDGKFLPMANLALMIPMLEMAGGHFQFIDEVLYLYNRSNPNEKNNTSIEGYIRSLASYEPLKEPPYHR
jgi:glycosyltransferase involved in cell wall biosynthesis